MAIPTWALDIVLMCTAFPTPLPEILKGLGMGWATRELLHPTPPKGTVPVEDANSSSIRLGDFASQYTKPGQPLRSNSKFIIVNAHTMHTLPLGGGTLGMGWMRDQRARDTVRPPPVHGTRP